MRQYTTEQLGESDLHKGTLQVGICSSSTSSSSNNSTSRCNSSSKGCSPPCHLKIVVVMDLLTSHRLSQLEATQAPTERVGAEESLSIDEFAQDGPNHSDRSTLVATPRDPY